MVDQLAKLEIEDKFICVKKRDTEQIVSFCNFFFDELGSNIGQVYWLQCWHIDKSSAYEIQAVEVFFEKIEHYFEK